VHRDFKPENVLVDERADGEARLLRARVTDFGLAQPVPSADSSERDGPVSLGHTQWLSEPVTRAAGGTLLYMSPEQLDGRVVGKKSDQFSFAVALYECVYGRHPFFAGKAPSSVADLRRAISAGPAAPPPATGEAPPLWLWPILERALRVAPDERWPSMHAMVEALERGEGGRADWHIGAHVAGLSLMFFIHLFLMLVIPIGLMVPDSNEPTPGPQWAYDTAGIFIGVLIASGWAPFGMVMTALSAYGMLRRRPWAYVTTAIYAATALLSCFGTPYALFAAYSLTRPAVRHALGRKLKRQARAPGRVGGA
jgi:hypothetical protein